jgi:hypothetical protein
MNDLQMIENLLTEAPPSQDVVAAGRERLRMASRQRIFRIPRLSWPVTAGFGLTAVAATVAIAVAATGTTPRGTPATPDQQVRLSASQVLLAAATKADLQPQTTGRYWHTATRSSWTIRVGTKANPYMLGMRQREDRWLAREPVHGTSWSWRQDLGSKPLTMGDIEAWKRAGSPAMAKMINPRVVGKQVPIGQPTTVTGGRTDPTGPGDAIYAIGPKNVTMKDLIGLPTDPARLKAYLLSMYKGHGTESTSQPMSADVWLFTVSSGLVMGMPTKPAVRAAAYRMLSKLDGVTVIGTVKDPDGRTGTAVAINEGGTQHRLIVDRASGRALASEEVVVKPTGTTEGFAPGSVFASSVYQADGWTNDKPHAPTW